MQIDYLANHPEWVPIIAEWSYSAWHKYDATLTVERSMASIQTRLSIDKIPLTLVVIDNNRPIGTANLKTSVPVPDVPKDKIWLGSFYIEPQYRNQGLGTALLQRIYKEALRFGYKEIYLFTSDPDVPDWYEKRGWESIEKLPYQNHSVVIMRWEHTQIPKNSEP